MSSLQENLKPRSCLWRGLRFHCYGRTDEVNNLFIGGGSRPSDKGGGGGGGGRRAVIQVLGKGGRGRVSKKNSFFGLKIRGRPGPPAGPSPRSATVYYMAFLAVVPKKFRYASIFLSVTYKSKESWSLEKIKAIPGSYKNILPAQQPIRAHVLL